MSNTVEMKESVFTTYHWIVFTLCWFGGIVAGMNAHIFSLMMPQAIAELSLISDRTHISQTGGYILALFLAGWMLGGIFFGYISDKFGRKITMMICFVMITLSTCLAAFSHTTWELAFCRFLTGLGVGGEMLCISVYLAETWPGRSRALALGALITSYQVGVFLSGFVSHFFINWREAFMVASTPLLLVFLIQWKLKESIQWLTAKQESADISQIKGFLKNVFVGSVGFGSLLVGYWASSFWVPTWIQDMVGPQSVSEKNYATMLHALCAICGCILAGYLVNRLGRLTVLISTFFGAFMVSQWMFFMNESFTKGVYWQYSLLGFFFGVLQAGFYIYLPELFPTRIRGTAVGFCLNSGRLVTTISVLLVGLLVPFFWRVFIYFNGICKCVSVGYLCMSFWKRNETAKRIKRSYLVLLFFGQLLHEVTKKKRGLRRNFYNSP